MENVAEQVQDARREAVAALLAAHEALQEAERAAGRMSAEAIDAVLAVEARRKVVGEMLSEAQRKLDEAVTP